MTTRSICISAAVLLLALTLTWPAFPGQNNTKRIGSQCTGAEGDRSVLAGLVRNSGGEKFTTLTEKVSPWTAACSGAAIAQLDAGAEKRSAKQETRRRPLVQG